MIETDKYVILGFEEQNNYDNYPEWCDLCWFHNCVGVDCDIEKHYHDTVEIWLWHRGSAEGVIDGNNVALYPGVMVYASRGSLHQYNQDGKHNNTGISPRVAPDVRVGHLHIEETGEDPRPEFPAFWFTPEENNPRHPAEFPEKAFLRHAYRGEFKKGDVVCDENKDVWWGVLVREGALAGSVDGEDVDLPEGSLLLIRPGVKVYLKAKADSEAAFAVGK